MDLYPTDYDRRALRSGAAKALALGGGRPAAKVDMGDPLNVVHVLGGALDADGHPLTQSSGRRLSPQAAWGRQGWYRKCADTRAKAVASLPWAVYEDGAEPGDYEAALYTSADVAPPDDLAPLADLEALLYLTEASLALLGRAYTGLLRPDRTVRGRLGRIEGFQWFNPLLMREKYGDGGIERFLRTVNGREEPVDPEAVVAVYQPDPFREIGPGGSDGAAATVNAAALDSLAVFVARYLDGGLIKRTILTIDNGGMRVDPVEASALESWWRKFLGRGGDPAETKVMNHRVKPEVIGEGLGDLSDDKLTQEQREAIAAAFGIPFSVMMSNAANYATAEVEERGFLLRTAVPQARIIARAFNRQLLRPYGLALRFEPERTETMQRFELEKAEKVHAVVGAPVLTVDEGRRLLGYEPLTPEQTPQPAPEVPPDEAPAGGDGQAIPEAKGVLLDDVRVALAERFGRGLDAGGR